MAMTKAQARVVGVVLVVIMFGGAVGVVIYQMRKPDQAKVVVLEPAAGAEKTSAATLAPGPAGVVVNASSSPVASAEVLVATPDNWIDVYNTARRDGPVVRSDKDGRFAFPPMAAWTDLVVRSTQGFAHVRSGEMPADGRVVLQAWGRVEGVLRIGSNPAADQPIALQTRMMPRVVASTNPSSPMRLIGSAARLGLSQTVRTDENGRFVFPRVMPGMTNLARDAPRILQSGGRMAQMHTVASIDVSPGQTVQVEIGGTGRPVVGRVVLENADERLPFFGSINLMTDQTRVGLRMPPNWATLSEPERAKFYSDWYRSMRPPLTAPVNIAADGSFRAEDIPPGQHMLRVSSQSVDPTIGSIEVLAEGELAFTMPPIPGDRSDEPLDVGTVKGRLRPRVKIGTLAPALEATRADGNVVKLSDYRGKFVLLAFVFDYGSARQPAPAQLIRSAAVLQDRAGSQDRLAMLAVMLPQQPNTPPYSAPAITGWTVVAVKDWRQRLDANYTNAPGTFLIDPDGKVLAKVSPFGNASYAVLDRTLELMNWHAPGVAVVMEKLPADRASPAFAFKTIPTISKNDAGQNAVFSIVDGRKADFGGDVGILNDGLGPRHDQDESLMCAFQPGSVEGRIKADLGKILAVEQINSYAWFKDGHRWAQVYRVYGTDGSRPGFNPEPKIGTDPASCGWSLIAAVDTRETRGGTSLRDDDRGQAGVSIRSEAGPIGKYRYLLFVTFATETHNAWGQTFWSEIDVVGR
ncbi:MAG: hypothetical protein NTU53_10670 [Planctomycetota bacterium]|nr:hypothetical protein [Planctomycetota bacterium]